MTIEEYLNLAKEFDFRIYRGSGNSSNYESYYTPDEYKKIIGSESHRRDNCESDIMLPSVYSPEDDGRSLPLCGYRYKENRNYVKWKDKSVLFYPINFNWLVDGEGGKMDYDTATTTEEAREKIIRRMEFLKRFKKTMRKKKIEEL